MLHSYFCLSAPFWVARVRHPAELETTHQEPISSIILVLFSSFVGSFGAVGLKLGAERLGGGITKLLTNYWLALGISLYLISSERFTAANVDGLALIVFGVALINFGNAQA